jgi:hypothetical protein
MSTKYSVFRNHEGKDLLNSEVGFIKSDSSNQYSKVGPVEILSTPKVLIMVNHTDKIIIINEPESKSSDNTADIIFEIERMIKKGTQPQFTKLSSSIGQYSVQVGEGEFERIIIQYGLKDFILYRLDLYYRRAQSFDGSSESAAKPLLVIEYSDIDKHPRFNKETFSIKQFVTKLAENYTPSLKYKDYEVLDQTKY